MRVVSLCSILSAVRTTSSRVSYLMLGICSCISSATIPVQIGASSAVIIWRIRCQSVSLSKSSTLVVEAGRLPVSDAFLELLRLIRVEAKPVTRGTLLQYFVEELFEGRIVLLKTGPVGSASSRVVEGPSSVMLTKK